MFRYIWVRFLKKSTFFCVCTFSYQKAAEFISWVKCTIFWLNRGLMVYFDMYLPDFEEEKKYLKVVFTLELEKVLWWKQVLAGNFFENMTYTNQKISSNLYGVKQKWCILVQQQSQRPHFRFITILLVQLGSRVASPFLVGGSNISNVRFPAVVI